jgi:AraC-like DNA-binding protein
VAERKKRNKLHQAEEAEGYLRCDQRQIRIREAAALFLHARLAPEDAALLGEEGMLSRFAFAFIPLNFAVLPEYPAISEAERRKILEWEMDITEHLGASFFPHALLLPHSTANGAVESFLLFVWGLTPEAWESGAIQFREQLIKTSVQLTRLKADVLSSGFYESPKDGEAPPQVLASLEDLYYHTPRGNNSRAVKKARQFILDNVTKRIMLRDVAEYAGISPGYLSTLFRKEYNQSMVDFINQVKINRACELLWENEYRINEISNMLGFENAFYFSRVFHHRTGLTPSEYQARRG